MECERCHGKGYVLGGCDRSGQPVAYKCSACNGEGVTEGAKNTEQLVPPDSATPRR